MTALQNRFDVNDAELREGFLRREVPSALAKLRDDAVARWGRMTAQQMVEHLIWAFELSTGRAVTECFFAATELPRMKSFLPWVVSWSDSSTRPRGRTGSART